MSPVNFCNILNLLFGANVNDDCSRDLALISHSLDFALGDDGDDDDGDGDDDEDGGDYDDKNAFRHKNWHSFWSAHSTVYLLILPDDH